MWNLVHGANVCKSRTHRANSYTYPHDEDEGPAGEEDEVADEEAGDPDDGQPHVDELEALRRPRQEVPALKRIGDIQVKVTQSLFLIL